jgi:Domain of unknown function (DUF932)
MRRSPRKGLTKEGTSIVKLVSKFSLKNVAKVGDLRSFLDEDTLRRVTPSVFAAEPHYSRSDKYQFISTADVMEGLADEGFRPVYAAQAVTRMPDKRDYTKHLLRFRREADLRDGVKEVAEIVALNSHGGESRFQLFAGVFRFICLNGMVAGETVEDIKLRHSGKLVEDVVAGAARIAGHFETVMGQVDAWKQIRLGRDEQRALAESAAVMRLGEPVEGKPVRVIDASEFDTVRRSEDLGNDLWTVHNRIQENVIAGGMEGFTRSANGRRRRTTTRPVNGIDQNITLNRALWTLSERMAEIKAA